MNISATYFKTLTFPMLLSMVFLFVPFFSHAQNCFTQVDPKTSAVSKSGVTELSGDSVIHSSKFVLMKTDTDLSVSWNFFFPSRIDNPEAGKMKVFMKFVNGQTRTYSAKLSSNVLKLPGGAGIRFDAVITVEDLSYFHLNSISELSLKFNDNGNSGLTILVNELNAKQIVESTACLADDK